VLLTATLAQKATGIVAVLVVLVLIFFLLFKIAEYVSLAKRELEVCRQ
jgi:succinate dehydrogenase hydrophobic anchor subunit